MPILWRYLLSNYLRVLFLCTLSFIAILLVMRVEEIAHFATLGASLGAIGWFILYQIPYILPIALPFSSLISSILLLQRLSNTYELTALRSCGFGLRDILSPIILSSILISICSFYIVSEVATRSHLTAGLLKTELKSINPLLLLHNKQFMRLKGFYFDVLGNSRLGETASDIVLSMPNKKNSRLNVMIGKNLQIYPESFEGKNISIISSLSTNNEEQFDHLIIENIGNANTTLQDFSQMVHKKIWTVHNDHLRIGMLLARIEEATNSLAIAIKKQVPSHEIKQLKRNISRASSEVIRRISIALAVFSFTLMGAAFGIKIGRRYTNKGLYAVIAMASGFLIAYFAAKAMEHIFSTALLLYLVPHILIITLSIWTLRKAMQGIET